MTHRSQIVYQQSYKKQDLQYTGLAQCIDSPLKSRTNNTLVSTSVLIVLQKVRLMTHWFQLVYQQSYLKQDLQNTFLNQCINCPTKKVGFTIHWSGLVYQQSYEKQDLRYTGLDHCINSPTIDQAKQTVGLKTTKIHLVGLST